jgi:hypothetical protein
MLNRCGLFALSVAAAALFAGPLASFAQDPTVIAPLRANQSLTMNALLGFVNGEPVFVDSLLRPLDEQLRSMSKKARDLSQFKQAARNIIEGQLQSTVSDILITSSAKAAMTEEDKGKLDMLMAKIRHDLIAKHGGSRAMAEQALRAQGSTVESEIADQRRHLTVQLYIQKQIRPKIVVTRQMVVEEYQRNPKSWQQESELELFTITLPVSRWLPREPGEGGKLGPVKKDPTSAEVQQAKAAALAKARELTAQLKASDNPVALFAQLAEDNQSIDGRGTKGGRTPNVKRGSLASTELENYVFSLPAKTVGEPFMIDDKDPMRMRVVVNGVGEKKEPRTVTLSEAQQEIRGRLEQQQYKQLSNAYMESLYDQAAIERRDNMIDTALDAAVARYASQ